MAGKYCEGKIKMASEKVSRKMLLEIKYVNANYAVIHTENSKLLLDLNCSPTELEKTVVELNIPLQSGVLRTIHQQNERFSSVQVKVRVSK